MRKIVYLIAVVFALVAVSCTKQDIRPKTNTTSCEPTWRVTEGDSEEEEIEGNGGITDPNKEVTEEEDANSNNAN
ncbi:MAG: hypothetical protein MK066_03225 [Crocinitomicaceae bacterium]|nr:hypothetical protein [Crocinitomicaceae bacterium]